MLQLVIPQERLGLAGAGDEPVSGADHVLIPHAEVGIDRAAHPAEWPERLLLPRLHPHLRRKRRAGQDLGHGKPGVPAAVLLGRADEDDVRALGTTFLRARSQRRRLDEEERRGDEARQEAQSAGGAHPTIVMACPPDRHDCGQIVMQWPTANWRDLAGALGQCSWRGATVMMKSLRLTSAIVCALVLSVSSACGDVADPGNSGSATPLSSSGATSTPEPSSEVILNPETAPRALLALLQRVVIHVRLQTPLGPNFTICTKASVGWNDCFVADATAGPGVVVGGYVAADRRLEVWLLDEQANVAQPIRHLGDVLVPVDLATLPEVALDFAVSIDGASPGTTSRAGDRVTLLDAVTTDALSSTDWPGLSNGGGTVSPAQPGNE